MIRLQGGGKYKLPCTCDFLVTLCRQRALRRALSVKLVALKVKQIISGRAYTSAAGASRIRAVEDEPTNQSSTAQSARATNAA